MVRQAIAQVMLLLDRTAPVTARQSPEQRPPELNRRQAPSPLRLALRAARGVRRFLDQGLNRQNRERMLAWTQVAPQRALARRRRLDYPHADIYLRMTSMAEYNRTRACEKEPWTVEWIEQWVKPGDVLYDVGANVGAYSLVAAKHTGGQARVVAFEPGFATYSALCENVVHNGCADSVIALPVGLSSETRLGFFNYRDLQAGAADHTLGQGPLTHQGVVPLYRQPLLTYRLDDLVEQFGLPLPNHVKIDVDGSEIAVLEGATRTLASPTLKSLLLEVARDQSDEVTRLLAARGLALRTKIEQRHGRTMTVWYGLFTPARGSAD